MKSRAHPSRFYCLLALALVGGCRTSVHTQSHYVLDAERAQHDSVTETTGILDVHRLTIDRTYDFKGLVYKRDLHEYAIDYYNGFLVSPSQMMTECTRDWLSKAHLFARVLDPGSQAEPTHNLEGHIINLYGDYQDKQQPKAVLEMRFFLIKHEDRTGRVLLSETYTETQSMETMDAPDLVQSLDDCLARILEALEADVSEALN
jgi:ABC-type uncharacterized transport system auxiliary subunit